MGYFWDFQLAIQQIWYNCSSTVGPKTSLNYGTGTALYGRGQLGAIWRSDASFPLPLLLYFLYATKDWIKKLLFQKKLDFEFVKNVCFTFKLGKWRWLFKFKKLYFAIWPTILGSAYNKDICLIYRYYYYKYVLLSYTIIQK